MASSFLSAHADAIGTIESSLRSLTWFLPWFRFREADFASESLTALLNLTGLYHDILTHRIVQSKPKGVSQFVQTDHSRYTTAWSSTNRSYRRAARLLEIVKYTQLVIEMALRRRVGARAAWRGIVALEILKAALHITILHVTRRPLSFPPLPKRDGDIGLPDQNTVSIDLDATSKKPLNTPEHIKNNHSLFPPSSTSIPSPLLTARSPPRSLDEYLSSKALTPSAVSPPTRLIAQLVESKEWVAELVYILRPLVYGFIIAALSISRSYRRNSVDPRPLYLSIALDLLHLYLRRPASPAFPLERMEYARRDREFLWYLLRGALWQSYSRPKIVRLVETTAAFPLVGMFATLIGDWVPLIDRYHYCRGYLSSTPPLSTDIST